MGQGRAFLSAAKKSALEFRRTDARITAIYSLQCNIIIEKMLQTTTGKIMQMSVVSSKMWEERLPIIVSVYWWKEKQRSILTT